MPSRALNHSRYNSLFKPCVFHEIRWTASLHDPRTSIVPPFDPRLLLRPRWRDEIARSSISRGIASKIIPNLPILGINHELKGIMVNKARIHRELRYFRDIFWILIKLDNELRWEIRENGGFRKITQRSIHGIKNHSIWNSNRGEIKDGSGRKFSESQWTYTKIKIEIELN